MLPSPQWERAQQSPTFSRPQAPDGSGLQVEAVDSLLHEQTTGSCQPITAAEFEVGAGKGGGGAAAPEE